MTTATFDHDRLPALLDAMDDAERHALPFGVVGLDHDDTVHFFSRTEAQLSGHGNRPAVGLPFFERVAPCMGTPAFQDRIRNDRRTGTLDIEFGHVGDFADAKRPLRVRAMSAGDGGIWLAYQRQE